MGLLRHNLLFLGDKIGYMRGQGHGPLSYDMGPNVVGIQPFRVHYFLREYFEVNI